MAEKSAVAEAIAVLSSGIRGNGGKQQAEDSSNSGSQSQRRQYWRNGGNSVTMTEECVAAALAGPINGNTESSAVKPVQHSAASFGNIDLAAVRRV